MDIKILGIETSCDDTSAAVVSNDIVLSNIISSQLIHKQYGGVVPELASRSHIQNIIPVTIAALEKANIKLNDIDAISYTQGPGLLGSLLVGDSFAKGLSIALGKKLIAVNHLHAHVMALFLKYTQSDITPSFPFICLLVSGGHTNIIVVKSHYDFNIIGHTIDDAAGEAFDKIAKILNLQYPGGPIIDKYAQNGNSHAFSFSKPNIPDLNFSFSGLKTSVLYFINNQLKKDPDFINKNINDICASVQYTIVDILISKLLMAVKKTNIHNIAIAGGVAANSLLRQKIIELQNNNVKSFIPRKEFTTDNAAMVAIMGMFNYKKNIFSSLADTAFAR